MGTLPLRLLGLAASEAEPRGGICCKGARELKQSIFAGMHEVIGALNGGTSGVRPRFVARSHPLPLSVEESVGLDSVLMVLAALFVLVHSACSAVCPTHRSCAL